MREQNRQIPLEERKRIQLEMLVEIDKFCREHNIKYMLAFGTLLGAIRHKGYIPWDDDVDISMSLEDILRFKREFKSEKLKYCDIDTEKNYEWPFSRITHKDTYCKPGLICKTYGVNIDLYPIIEVNSSMEHNKSIAERMMTMFNIYSQIVKFRRRVIKVLPITTIIGFKSLVRKYKDKYILMFSQKHGGAFHFIAGPLTQFGKHTLNFNPLSEIIEVDFEGHKFMAPAKYKEYLSYHYGDYMQLPPEDQRHPYHLGKYFWK